MAGPELPPVSRNQLDRAGSRVRKCRRDRLEIADSVLKTIDAFRGWHLPNVQDVQQVLSDMFHKRAEMDEKSLPITSRLKTSPTIIAKLGRSETSLPRMQDIAGARIVVPALELQDVTVGIVKSIFGNDVRHVKDQREEPDQWGYRAVHVIIERDGRLAEVQIRTPWQDRWA